MFIWITPHLIRRLACTAVALTVFAAASPGWAQVQLQGRVIEEATELPVAGAQVTLLSWEGRSLGRRLTDDRGVFEFEVRGPGMVRLRTERIGYRETVTPVLFFDNYDSYRVEIRMDPEAVLLAPLEVVARSRSRVAPMLEGFEHRRANGNGWYFTRSDIEDRSPAYVTDLLVQVPGVRLLSSGRGSARSVSIGRAPDRPECPAQLYVDGFLINRRIGTAAGTPSEFMTIDEVLSPRDVEGIEVYGGFATVPAEFLSPDAECGVVAIWTRRGP